MRTGEAPSLADVAKNAAHDLFDLLAAQIKLARIELAGDLHTSAARALRVALFIPPIILGYAFGMAAAAAWLSRAWGLPAALGAIALLNGAVGCTGIVVSVAALRRLTPMRHTQIDVSDTIDTIVHAGASRNGTSHA